MGEYALPLAAFIIAAAALIATALNARRAAAREDVIDLRAQMVTIERRLWACEEDRDQLRNENIALMRRVVRLEKNNE